MGRGPGTDAYSGGAEETPEHPASVSAFRLDVFEVTVGRFRRFVQATIAGWQPPAGSGKHAHLPGGGIAGEMGWDPTWPALPATEAAWEMKLEVGVAASYPTFTPAEASTDNLPINWPSWYASYAFCVWDGGFLPTEAEFEFAAAGGEENRLFPWGFEPADTQHAVYQCEAGGTSGTCTLDDLLPVGSIPLGIGRYGHYDLAGSMWELSLDTYDASFYSGAGATCSDCANLAPGSSWTERGGSWKVNEYGLRAARRAASVGGNSVGIRCARIP
jgi:formylglycine-generating enzyme